jgi:hypothetical protein
LRSTVPVATPAFASCSLFDRWQPIESLLAAHGVDAGQRDFAAATAAV